MNSATKVILLTESDVQRFWTKVNKAGSQPDQSNPHYAGLGPCWEWLGNKHRQGYGLSHASGVMVYAHRVSWSIHNYEPSGFHVLHKCDNESCVNPEHLFTGTNCDNIQDSVNKGRRFVPSGEAHWTHLSPEKRKRGDQHWTHEKPHLLARGDANGARKHPERLARGERNGSSTHPESIPRGSQKPASKLTEEKVREIRRGYAAGEGSQKYFADKFGVSQGLIYFVVSRKYWSHI